MRILFVIVLPMMFIPLAFGQLDANSITVTASRDITPGQPDQVLFSVDVMSGFDTNLDDIIAALQGSGITVTNFSGLSSSFLSFSVGVGIPSLPPPMLDWSFRFAVPFSSTKDTMAKLSTVQQSLAKKNTGLSISFTIIGAQVSAQSQATCPFSDLVADARARAQRVADAGGVAVGNILAMSSASSSAGLIPSVSLGVLPATTLPPTPCSLTVKFALSRF